LRNFRDVGGLQTTDGRTLRTGVLFRSDDPWRLNADDRTKIRDLGIRLICDLRAPEQSRKRPARLDPSIRVVNISLHDPAVFDLKRTELLGYLFGDGGADRFREYIHSYYRHLAFARTAEIGEVITLLSREGNTPALIHCTAGKDRTGLIVALIQLGVGVSYEAVLADYLRTNDAFAPSLTRFIKIARRVTLFRVSEARIRTVLMAHPEHLDRTHAEILQRFGSIPAYLVDACGVDPNTIEQLKRRLLI
jgi:protein-tyrosine phosphatase